MKPTQWERMVLASATFERACKDLHEATSELTVAWARVAERQARVKFEREIVFAKVRSHMARHS